MSRPSPLPSPPDGIRFVDAPTQTQLEAAAALVNEGAQRVWPLSAACLRRRSAVTLLALSPSDEVVGTASILSKYLETGMGEIGMRAVRPDHRRRGISRCFFSRQIEMARRAGLGALYSRFHADNRISQHSMLRYGFQLVGERKSPWSPRTLKYAVLPLAWPLEVATSRMWSLVDLDEMPRVCERGHPGNLHGPTRQNSLGRPTRVGAQRPLTPADRASVASLIATAPDGEGQPFSVRCGDASLSRHALLEQASRIAGHLAGLGVKPGDVVAIPQTPWLGQPSAILGALWAGAAITWVSSHLHAVAAVIAPEGCDDSPPLVAPVAPPARAITSVDWGACGSGRREPIEGVHGALSHVIPWFAYRFGLREDDCVALVHQPSTAWALLNLMPALFVGAGVDIPPDGAHTGAGLADWLTSRPVTVAVLNADQTRAITQQAGRRRSQTLRWIFVLGGPIPPSETQGLRRLAPHSRIVHLFGSAHSGLALAFHEQPPHEKPGLAVAGWGLAGAEVVVIGADGFAAAPGEEGPVHIRSRWLANSQAPTTPAAYTDDPHDRLCPTGDRGYVDTDLGLVITSHQPRHPLVDA